MSQGRRSRDRGLQKSSNALLLCGLLAAGCGGTKGEGTTPATSVFPPVSECEGLVACTAECDGGNLSACVHLGGIHERGVETPADDARALALYTRACDGKEPLGCERLASVYEVGVLVPRDDAKAARFLEQARELFRARCDRRHGASCSSLGLLLERDRKDAEALALHEKACALGDADGCSMAAMLVDDGRGAKVDFQRAFDLYVKACDLGDSYACDSAAGYLGDFGTLPRDREREQALSERSRAMSEKACVEKKERYSCSSAAIDYQYADTPDEERAFELYSLGCDLGNQYACGQVAARLDAKDPAGATVIRQRACDLGDETSCKALHAAAVKEGRTADAEKIARLYLDRLERACRRAESYPCVKLVEVYKTGSMAPADPAKVAELRARIIELDRRECPRGFSYACTRLAKMLEEDAGGRHVASEHYQTACDLGDESSCWLLSQRWSGQRAEALRERACELGEPDACTDGRYDEPEEHDEDYEGGGDDGWEGEPEADPCAGGDEEGED